MCVSVSVCGSNNSVTNVASKANLNKAPEMWSADLSTEMIILISELAIIHFFLFPSPLRFLADHECGKNKIILTQPKD
jgi:hypothetical protein